MASGTRTSLGTLAPSECVSIPVQTISGVYASCALEAAIDSRPAVIDEPGKARGVEGATAQLQRPQQNNSNENYLQSNINHSHAKERQQMSAEVGSGQMKIMAHRIFTETIPMPGITPGNNVVASLTEVDVNGNPFIGDATMKIYNVAPRNGDIQVRGEVDWDEDIDIRISVIFQ